MTSVFFCYQEKALVCFLGKVREKCIGEDRLARFWLALGPQSFLRGKRWEWSYRHPRDLDRLDLDFWNSAVDFSLFHSCVQSLKGV